MFDGDLCDLPSSEQIVSSKCGEISLVPESAEVSGTMTNASISNLDMRGCFFADFFWKSAGLVNFSFIFFFFVLLEKVCFFFFI